MAAYECNYIFVRVGRLPKHQTRIAESKKHRGGARPLLRRALDQNCCSIYIAGVSAIHISVPGVRAASIASDLTLSRKSAAVPRRFPRDVLPGGNGRNSYCF